MGGRGASFRMGWDKEHREEKKCHAANYEAKRREAGARGASYEAKRREALPRRYFCEGIPYVRLQKDHLLVYLSLSIIVCIRALSQSACGLFVCLLVCLFCLGLIVLFVDLFVVCAICVHV